MAAAGDCSGSIFNDYCDCWLFDRREIVTDLLEIYTKFPDIFGHVLMAFLAGMVFSYFVVKL